MNHLRRWAFPVFALVMLGLPLLPVPDFWMRAPKFELMSEISQPTPSVFVGPPT